MMASPGARRFAGPSQPIAKLRRRSSPRPALSLWTKTVLLPQTAIPTGGASMAGKKVKSRAKAAKKAPARRARAADGNLVLVATRKGAWLYRGDKSRSQWRTDGPHFLGHIIQHLMLD